MSTAMRAKLAIASVTKMVHADQLKLHGVARSNGYPPDGLDEDNTFAKMSPHAELTITITNPALIGKFNPGDKFYVDFTPVPVADAQAAA